MQSSHGAQARTHNCIGRLCCRTLGWKLRLDVECEGEELLDSEDYMKSWIAKIVGEYDALHMPGGLVPCD